MSGMVSPLIKSNQSGSLHSQLSEVLRNNIFSRKWVPGTKIPSEHCLMKTYDLSRGTVRHALKTLVEEGLLVQVHGKGTYVADNAISHPAGIRPLSFAESFMMQGIEFKTNVVDKTVVPAPENVARMLHIEPGVPALFLRRVRTVDSEPVICQESWLNLSQCPGLADCDFVNNSAFNLVQETSGRVITSSLIRYSARTAGHDHGCLLHVEDSAPVLVLEQEISLSDSSTVEWSYTWLKAGQEVIGTAFQGSIPVM